MDMKNINKTIDMKNINKNIDIKNIKKNNSQSSISNLKDKLSNRLEYIKSKISIKSVLITILIIILLIIIIYVGVAYYNYRKTQCYEKKEFFKYLIDFKNSDVCIKEKAPIKKPVNLPPPEKPKSINILPKENKEVFHISNQDYTYEQSKCKCSSYGGRLATKSELIDAYNNGSNWTTYGWSEGQNAYYPVQKCYYDLIQKENERIPEEDRTFTGFPGLNGGHFPNDNLKFGVNCFGVKPKGSISKLKKSECPPMNFCKLDTNYEANNRLETDEIVGFNEEKWNM